MSIPARAALLSRGQIRAAAVSRELRTGARSSEGGLIMSEEDLMALLTRRKAIGLFPFVTLASPSSLFLFNPSSANAQAVTKPSGVQLLS